MKRAYSLETIWIKLLSINLIKPFQRIDDYWSTILKNQEMSRKPFRFYFTRFLVRRTRLYQSVYSWLKQILTPVYYTISTSIIAWVK